MATWYLHICFQYFSPFLYFSFFVLGCMCFYVCVFVCVLQVRMVYLENVTTHKHNMNHFDTGVTLNVNWLWRPCWFTALWVYTAALVGWNGIVPFLNQTLTSGQTAPFLVEQRYAAKVNIFIIHPSLRSDTGGLLFLRTFWKMYCMVVILRGQLNSFNDPDRTLHQPRSLTLQNKSVHLKKYVL